MPFQETLGSGFTFGEKVVLAIFQNKFERANCVCDLALESLLGEFSYQSSFFALAASTSVKY